jgi:hypothetical protein
MITEDKSVAVRVLKSLWVLWEKKYDTSISHWPSQETVQEFHEFIIKNGKLLGITDNWDDLGFWYNAMILNEDNLYNKTLTKDNVELPTEKELELQFQRIEWEKVAYDYEDTMSSYFTPEQIKREFWFFNNEDYIDIGSFNNTNKEYIDGEIEDEHLTSVKEITPRQKESVDDYITNLSEGELDYMVKKLLDTHLHYNSK